jgi:hypothetical protein
MLHFSPLQQRCFGPWQLSEEGQDRLIISLSSPDLVQALLANISPVWNNGSREALELTICDIVFAKNYSQSSPAS